MFALAAIILFILAAFGDNQLLDASTMIAIGLACLALAIFVGGNWPFGGYFNRRQQ